MNRVPWAPLNAGVFLIIFGGLILVSFFNFAGINLFTVFPLIFAVFGAWLVVEAFVIPPADAYAPPKIMIVGWGALISGLGILWYIGATAGPFLPLAFAVMLVIAGIAAVATALRRLVQVRPRLPRPSPCLTQRPGMSGASSRGSRWNMTFFWACSLSRRTGDGGATL